MIVNYLLWISSRVENTDCVQFKYSYSIWCLSMKCFMVFNIKFQHENMVFNIKLFQNSNDSYLPTMDFLKGGKYRLCSV